MTTPKERMQAIFEQFALGNSLPFVDAMAEDFCWIIPGRSTWSGQWRGKQAVLEGLLRPLSERFATRYTNRAVRMVAEGELVVVECRGHVTTQRGQVYDNSYCFVCRFADGRLRELTEYMDTELAASVLGPP